ncbi:MAG TPA: hypothetical protein VK728_04370 [Candidatus Sulfotelmatobacter sp.]|jgi:hypothetical protein|nr:hypothetical protein [Candidatus Sulfotelmatobacter sp.]
MDSSVPTWLSEPYVTILLASAFLLAAIFIPRGSERFFGQIEKFFAAIAEHKFLAVAGLFLFVIALRLALLSLLPVPNPGIHDEFGYLLMGDTFVHGRMANPPHPLWRSFETFHVLWFPAYASKYPPAQGLVLAFGQLLGDPWIGVLLSASAMAAAFVWALQAWMPARWALLAGVLGALRLCVASYWMNSYWGGAVAAIGGALVLGAFGRMKRRPSLALGILLGLGVAILFNSRPYESVFFCVPVAIAMLLWLRREFQHLETRRSVLRLIIFPAAIILLITGCFMARYNWRITGNAFLPPYAYDERLHVRAALFLWQAPRPPLHYNNAQLETFYNQYERLNYDRSWSTFKFVFHDKWDHCSPAFLWPACWLLVPGLFFLYRDARFRLPLLTLLAVLFGYSLVVWPGPHYIAPAAAIIFAALAQSIRHLRTMRILGRPVGAALSRVVLLALVFDVSLLVAQRLGDPQGWGGWGLSDRADLLHDLESKQGKHVVLVRYGLEHSVHEEWVFNGADIDGSKVIWARDLPGELNDQLLRYYPERTIWLATPDDNEVSLLRPPLNSH